MPTQDPREPTALHEAAHFVAAYVCGRHEYVTTVSIIPSDSAAGVMSSEDGFVDPVTGKVNAADVEAAIVVLYAGFAASMHAASKGETDSKGEKEHKIGAIHDDEVARKLMSIYGLSPEVEPSLREQARQVVEGNWGAVEALSKALLEFERLDTPEAVAAIQAAGYAPDEETVREAVSHLNLYRAHLAARKDEDASRVAEDDARTPSAPDRSSPPDAADADSPDGT